jgi:hypothetical protein
MLASRLGNSLHRGDFKHHVTGALVEMARGAVQHPRRRGLLDGSTHCGVLK